MEARRWVGGLGSAEFAELAGEVGGGVLGGGEAGFEGGKGGLVLGGELGEGGVVFGFEGGEVGGPGRRRLSFEFRVSGFELGVRSFEFWVSGFEFGVGGGGLEEGFEGVLLCSRIGVGVSFGFRVLSFELVAGGWMGVAGGVFGFHGREGDGK